MISLFFLGFLLLAVLWNLYYAKNWDKNLTVSLRFLRDFVYAGEQVELTEQLENRKRLALPVLEVAFHLDKNLVFGDYENTSVSDFTYKRDIFALLGSQRVTRKLTLDCTKRGYYRINQSQLTAFSMLHGKRFSVECPADADLFVYAKGCNVSDIFLVCEQMMGSVQCAKRLYEDPFAFSSIREYTIADPMKTINWKASARTGELMVNTFESSLTEKVMIYLDLEDSGILKQEYLIEESVSVAASLARRLIGRGMEVGLCLNVETRALSGIIREKLPVPATDENRPFLWIEPAGGRKQLTCIEQILADCKPEQVAVPFAELLVRPKDGFTQASSSKDAFTVLISKNVVQNQAAAVQFGAKQNQAVWVIPCPKNEKPDLEAPDNICLLKREVERS